MTVQAILTKKQRNVLKSYFSGGWKYLILAGAKRAGKTYINNYIFLFEIRRVAALAAQKGDKHPQYILAGFSSNTIYNNIVSSLTTQFGLDMKTDKHGHYHLFGVDIVPAYTGSARGMAAIRGMSSYGAYVNEASLAVEQVFQEIVSRCSVEHSRIIADSNPDIPTHWLKTNYIDNHNPKARIKSYSFTIDDNEFLPQDYVEAFKAATPKGVFYDRDILGLWVTGEGIVYSDFDKDTMIIDNVPSDLHYYVGVDWGFEHKNSILVFGDDDNGNTYLVEAHVATHKFIKHWVQVAKDIQQRYGYNINFWCDSARPDNYNEFVAAGVNAFNANKSVLAGIEAVGSRMKQNKFYVLKSASKDFLDEVYQYVWNEHTGEPIKEHDDVMDATRYAIYNQHKGNDTSFIPQFI